MIVTLVQKKVRVRILPGLPPEDRTSRLFDSSFRGEGYAHFAIRDVRANPMIYPQSALMELELRGPRC
jgi:hypothetical protein